MSPVVLFALAAVAMTVDAIGYSLGAIGPITAALAPTDAYWRRRLRLNVLLASHGLYLAAAIAWLAVPFFASHPTASAVLALVAASSALYSVVTVLWFTRRDAAHAIPRALALAAYVAAFALAAHAPIRADALVPAVVRTPTLVVRAEPGTVRSALRVVRVMHAMVLFEVDGLRVLTDPWWSTRRHYDAGESPGMAPGDLGALSLITSGQDHYDHSDFAALTFVPRTTNVVVPAGTPQADTVRAAGFTHVQTLRPWQSVDVGGVRLTAVPARAHAASGGFDDESAYVYEIHDRVVFFVGHRVEPAVATEVARRFPRVDLALVAINDLRVRPQSGRQLSMSPDDAAAVVRAVHARVAVPIHYRYHGSWLQDALLLSHEGTAGAFSDALQRMSPTTVLAVLEPGQPLVIE